ncbi:MAG: flavin-dependent oxidoreductase [Hyphomonas sp.]
MKITIAGGGIAGLVTALALHKDGHEVTVYEAVPELRALGVGINLLPQAVDILDRLNLTKRLLTQGVATRELSYVNRFGQHIWTEPRGKFGGFTSPQISISRGDLQMTLLDATRERLGAERVKTGMRLTGFRNTAEQAVGIFKNIQDEKFEIASDALICAEGIHSAARKQMYPHEGDPVYSGRILWRATSFAKPYLSSASMCMFGHQAQKFVCYPIAPVREDGLQRINWIAELWIDDLPNRADWNRPADINDFLPQFADWQFDWLDIPGLITSAETVYEYPMVDREPVDSWLNDRTVLLGDAAHPMYPIGSNGASQAILDAECLCRSLKAQPDVQSALAKYEDERRSATRKIILANRKNGPEQCMQLAHERAPEGFTNINDVFAPGELKTIADQYKQLTGMKKA